MYCIDLPSGRIGVNIIDMYLVCREDRQIGIHPESIFNISPGLRFNRLHHDLRNRGVNNLVSVPESIVRGDIRSQESGMMVESGRRRFVQVICHLDQFLMQSPLFGRTTGKQNG